MSRVLLIRKGKSHARKAECYLPNCFIRFEIYFSELSVEYEIELFEVCRPNSKWQARACLLRNSSYWQNPRQKVSLGGIARQKKLRDIQSLRAVAKLSWSENKWYLREWKKLMKNRHNNAIDAERRGLSRFMQKTHKSRQAPVPSLKSARRPVIAGVRPKLYSQKHWEGFKQISRFWVIQ